MKLFFNLELITKCPECGGNLTVNQETLIGGEWNIRKRYIVLPECENNHFPAIHFDNMLPLEVASIRNGVLLVCEQKTGAIAVGKGATAVGSRSVVIGGSVSGDIVTGKP